MARELGLGVVPYSPLAGGVLTGKYGRDDLAAAGAGDGTRRSFNPALGTVTERNLAVADAVREVAAELGRSSAQVALAWTLRNPAVTAPVVGARTPSQLADNLGALDVELTASQLARLDAASAIGLGYPHDMLTGGHIREVMTGGLRIEPRR
ncbi:hypothetical protein GCM10023082_01950 [Streptomyces tremellae]|uniref:NADP-dependent oxidoreductase domain-containing protein n=2 Tax=Streptomyces tremellae TaxID=1124239 RepID=A0ABP7DM52_9ACTN